MAAAGARVVADGSPPAAPGDLVGAPLAGSEIQLSWVDQSDNETGFDLWRSSGEEEWQRITVLPPDTTSYVDGGLSRNTRYNYRLRAENDSGASDWSNEARAATPAVPAPPRLLMAGALSSTHVSLTWLHLGFATTEISIWRKVAEGDWERVGAVPGRVSTFLDEGLLPDTVYEYRVRAHNSEGASEWSGVARCLTTSSLWVRHFGPAVRSAGRRTRIDLGFYLPPGVVIDQAAVRSVGPSLEAMELLPAVVKHREPTGRGYGFLTTGAYPRGVYLIRGEITYRTSGGLRNTVVSRWSTLVVP